MDQMKHFGAPPRHGTNPTSPRACALRHVALGYHMLTLCSYLYHLSSLRVSPQLPPQGRLHSSQV